MKVRASLWYAYPGAHAEITAYPSIRAVRADMEAMLYDSRRFGGPHPVGFIYPIESDDPIWMLEVSKTEKVTQTRC